MAQNELRVFISSTFRDLQQEREHLVKKIFPEIRSLCRQRGVTFTDIDLRWGITEEEAEKDGIIGICLDEIDRCRPYFICILGERYGWTPPRSDAEVVSHKFPILADAMMHGTSITEMEIVYGVLANPAMANHAFFYFRDRDATPAKFVDTDPDIARRLNVLKDRIRQSGFPVRENFTNVDELGTLIEGDLRRVIDIEHPASKTPSPLELERRAHRAYAASRTRAYVANPEYDAKFAAWLESQQEVSRPLVIAAESGLGKSSLIAHLVNEYCQQHPDALVIEHYVGASQSSGTATAIMRHIIEEIRERFGITDEAATKADELERSFPNWLYRGEHFAKQSNIEMLIVIDALNQLDETGRRLAWLPTVMPPSIKLVVSTILGPCADELTKREWARLDVQPIEDNAVRRAIVLHYLGEFHKGITEKQVRRVILDTKAASPLYLRVVAEELRLHGEHETLDMAIDRYAAATQLEEVFDRVLERLERDHGAATVDGLMSILWASRSGLSEADLIDLVGLSRIELSRLLFAFDYHFLQSDGLLRFFHDYLRRAVEKRYLIDEQKQRSMHLRIAEYFDSAVKGFIHSEGNVPRRIASELTYQLHSAGATERLQDCLSTMEVFLALYEGQTESEVLVYWSTVSESADIEASYREAVERWVTADAGKRSRGLGRVGHLLERLGLWDGAIRVQRERLASAILRVDKLEGAYARWSIGSVMSLRGEYSEALDELSQALEDFTELGDQRGIAYAATYIGNVYLQRGEYDLARESFDRSLNISTELGHHRNIAASIANLGAVYLNRGEYDRAHESYERCLRIFKELGDRYGIAIAYGNIANIYAGRAEYDHALENYFHAAKQHRAIGARRALTDWLEGIAKVLLKLHQQSEAMPEYLPKYLPNVSEDRWRVIAMHQARKFAEECIMISDTLPKPDTQFNGRLLLAQIEASEGLLDAARERLQTMLREATDEEQIADLHYHLWKLGVPGHAAKALAIYKTLYEQTPYSGYREFINELTAVAQ